MTDNDNNNNNDEAENHDTSNALLPVRKVIYCGKCGMPPEYCEYGPDFESHCEPWLRKHHPSLCEELAAKRGTTSSRGGGSGTKTDESTKAIAKPEKPWTTQERLTAFYEKYVPEKVADIPSLLEKYQDKEEKLFVALVKKYGPEPLDPYFADSASEDDSEDDDDEDDDDENDEEAGAGGVDAATKKKRRGAAAKKTVGSAAIRVVVSKVSQKKKRHLTVVSGMETVPNLKLKDVSKAFSKRFAGSSSVKENAKGEKEIIIQGDHMYDVAEMVVDKFEVPESAVFLDMDGDIVPLK